MRLGFFLFCLIFVAASPSMACKCIPADKDTSIKAYEEADAVVSAQIMLVSKGWGGSGPLATLEVQNVIKGNIKKNQTVVIQYNPSTAACGTSYLEGETYLIGLYDIKNMNSTKARVGNYRAIHSCGQDAIEYYYNNFMKDK